MGVVLTEAVNIDALRSKALEYFIINITAVVPCSGIGGVNKLHTYNAALALCPTLSVGAVFLINRCESRKPRVVIDESRIVTLCPLADMVDVSKSACVIAFDNSGFRP